MDIQNLLKVRQAILQNPMEFSISVHHLDTEDGRVVHDIGGWADVLFIPDWRKVHLEHPERRLDRAANVLGLNRAMAQRLMCPFQWPAHLRAELLRLEDLHECTQIAALTAARIEHFIGTDGYDA